VTNNDFTNFFWLIGRAIIEGRDPYTVAGNVYPPATSIFFAVFAFLPQNVSWVLWLVSNVLLFMSMVVKKKNGIKSFFWLGYTPLLFTFISGQIDFFLFWLSSFLEEDKWYVSVVAALITLKPQIALIVLPAFLLDWIRHKRKTLIKWLLFCLIIHGFPLILDAGLYYRWWMAMSSRANLYQTASPGFFSLTEVGVSLAVIIPISIAFVIFGLVLGKAESIQANLLALPFGTWYNSTFLLGTAPWQLIVPTSWIALLLAYLAKGVYPFALIPAVAFIWSVINGTEFQTLRARFARE
jgi:hypothetical protein